MLQQSSEDFMSDWGGKREGAGRKASSNGKTVVMRIPESKIEEVKQLISGVSDNGKNEFSELKELVSRWEEVITPDRMKQPRWEHAGRLLNELKKLVK
jgi:hypothetical protein